MAFPSFLFFSRALLGRCAGLLCALVLAFALLLSLAAPARAEDHELLVTWENPNPSIGGLKRLAGDADNWTFTVKLNQNLKWVRGPEWTYPQNSGDEDWGAFSGGEVGSKSLSWSSPLSGGGFRVGVTGRIRRTGGGGNGPAEEKEVDSAWAGDVTDVWDWTPEPALPSGTISARRSISAGQMLPLAVFGVNIKDDHDTRTNLAGKTEIKSDGPLQYTWSAGGQGQMSAVNAPFAQWYAPTNVPPQGLTVTITCTIDDSYGAGETGVVEPDTGTRNDEPVELTAIEIFVAPTPCGSYQHESWTPASDVVWTIDANGYPQPQTPSLTENAKWEDSCAGTIKPPIADQRLYAPAQGANDRTFTENGVLYREVSYTASSWYGGPNAPILKSRHALNRVWSANPPISGGEIVAVTEGTLVKPGESTTFAVSAAKDLDTWMRNGVSREESDTVRYTWSSSSGSFEGATDGTSVRWVAPAQADVPAGTGLTVTVTCVINDVWDGAATGVTAEGDTGTRNDGAAPTQTATIVVQRAPCGRWQHKSWKAGTLEWRTDSNGDPEPVTPSAAIETVQWVDECATTTKPDEERTVPYTLVSDAPVEVEGIWNRKAEYRAYSTCAGGTDSELLSGQRALPRHWSVPGDLDGGSMSIALTGAGTEGLTSPGTVTPSSTTALILPAGGGVSLSISAAKDGDTYSYWNVPEKTGDDTIRYKWMVTDEDGDETDLGTAATASWSGDAAGTFVIKGTVDDASGVDDEGNVETGVSEPDLGERNDDEIAYLVAVTIVAKEWNSGKGIGFRPALDDAGERIAPIEWIADGKLLLPKLGDETKAIPGEAVELEVEEASDWDAWQRAGIDSGIAADGPLSYKWTLTGGKFRVAGANGTFSEVTEATGRTATWIAPAPDPNATEGESFTVTCTIDDGTLPRVSEPETGTHDDEALVREVSIEVVPSYWAPEDKAIGFHPTLDENDVPVEPTQWTENGRITAPIDQRVENVPQEKIVLPGESVTATIEAAQDWDTLTTLEGKSIARDEALTYVWSSGGVGHFLIPGENGGEPTQAATATGLSATWVAPDDIEEDTDVELKCTVDDGEGAPVVAPLVGTRDDDKLERIVKVKVVLTKVEFEGLARSCAGGVAVDGVHDFTITGTTKMPDGTFPPVGTTFKLVFEGNKGVNKRATFVPDTQKGQALVPDTDGEEMTVVTDTNGQFPVQVLSSDIISSDIQIKVKRVNDEGKETEVGEQECEFAKNVSYRRFPNQYDPDEITDTGWLFDVPLLSAPGATTPAKIYLKHKINPTRGDIDGNWAVVNGHILRMKITKVMLLDGTVTTNPAVLKDYATVVDPNNDQASTRTVSTSNDGAAQATIKAGPLVMNAKSISVGIDELSQHDD